MTRHSQTWGYPQQALCYFCRNRHGEGPRDHIHLLPVVLVLSCCKEHSKGIRRLLHPYHEERSGACGSRHILHRCRHRLHPARSSSEECSCSNNFPWPVLFPCDGRISLILFLFFGSLDCANDAKVLVPSSPCKYH